MSTCVYIVKTYCLELCGTLLNSILETEGTHSRESSRYYTISENFGTEVTVGKESGEVKTF